MKNSYITTLCWTALLLLLFSQNALAQRDTSTDATAGISSSSAASYGSASITDSTKKKAGDAVVVNTDNFAVQPALTPILENIQKLVW